MDAKSDESESGTSSRKYGLPVWMVNGISERLNAATDFEQYASSPPQTEGFLAEYPDNRDSWITSGHCPSVDMSEKHEAPIPAAKTPSQPSPRDYAPYHPILRYNSDLSSSPDSTPCATPEPSPVVRRKVSIPHPADTVHTNPGGWFYMGKLRKNRTEPEEGTVTDKPKKQGIKLVITNFDLNAVSPTSW